MSTAVNFAQVENTTGVDQSNEDNRYLYGPQGTDPLAIDKDPEIKPRSQRRIKIASNFEQREKIKQTWSGTVLDCNEQELTARLEDLINPDNPDEIVVLSIEEIEDRQHSLIQKGAIFLWHIGYRYGPKYPRERFSKINFRRLPKWTEEEIQDAEKLAEEYANFFHANPTDTP